MKKHYSSILGAFVALALALSPTLSSAQCTTWVNPSDSTGWADINNMFGGAPCDDGTGCPFNEITAFEIFADEAYFMDNVVAGGVYTFSACNGAGGAGTGGTAWAIEFTIVAPSGAVDASGLDAGSSCALTWTASEAGSYLLVVSEAGACGTSANAAANNGFPAVSCAAGTACSTVSVDEIDAASSISIYPNPSTGIYSMELDVKPSQVQVMDMNGRIVQDINVQNTNGVITFDLSGKENGAYIVNVIADGVQFAERISLIK